MKKRFLSLLLVALMLASPLPVLVLAEVETDIVDVCAEDHASAADTSSIEEPAEEPVVEPTEEPTEKPKSASKMLLGAGSHSNHDGVTFTAWTSTNSLPPPTAGSYYLANDVAISKTWSPVNGTKLCLNGHIIQMTGTGSAIKVDSGVTFDLYDCTNTVYKFKKGEGDPGRRLWFPDSSGDRSVIGGYIINNKVQDVDGGGVNVAGTFNMHGGNIVGCGVGSSINHNGGGVLLTGTFNFYGGSISGCADPRWGAGGGIYVNSASAVCNLNGGTIRNCRGFNGGSIYLNAGTLNFSSGLITEGESSMPKVAEVTVDIAFIKWTYSVLDNVITATCSDNAIAPLSLTLLADNAIYHGNAYESSISGDTAKFSAETEATIGNILYCLEDGSTPTGSAQGAASAGGAPKYVGKYVALVTVTGKTGSVTAKKAFEIKPADLTVSVLPTAAKITYGQTLAGSSFTGGSVISNQTSAAVPGTFSWDDAGTMPQVSDSGVTEYSVTFTPTDTANYNSTICKVKLTVDKATPTLSGVSAGGITYGQTLSESSVTGTATNEYKATEKAVAGSFAFTVGTTAPAVSDSDTTQYEVTFTPTDTANYSEDVDRVEAILKEALPKIKEEIPTIIAGPFYKGVQELADSAVILRFIAYTTEDDRGKTRRAMNKKLKKLFDDNHISIPYPQMVITKRED